MSPDLINASFEFIGACTIGVSAYKCYREKSATGVHWIMTAFFFLWGFWNLYFYAELEQPLSWAAGVFMVTMNCIYTALIIKYRKKKIVLDSKDRFL